MTSAELVAAKTPIAPKHFRVENHIAVWFRAMVTLSGLVLVLLPPVLLFEKVPPSAIIALSALGLTMSIVVGVPIWTRQASLFNPLLFYTAIYGITFWLRPLLVMAAPANYSLRWVQYSDEGMLEATWLGAIGFGIFCLGYFSPLGSVVARILPQPSRNLRKDRVTIAVIIGTIICIASAAYLLGKDSRSIWDVYTTATYEERVGLLGGDGDVIVILRLGCWITAVLAYWLFLSTRGFLVRAFAICVPVLTVTLLLGFGARAPIVTILGTFLVIRNYVVHPISARNAAVIALVGLFVLSFWGQYRLTLSATFLEASDLLEITEKISEDFPEWDIVAAITDYYPNAQDYYYGQLIWETLYSVVPRRLWTSKPIWYGPYQISNDVFPGVLSPSVYGGFQGTFLSTSTIGAGYAEFGWVAAVVVMFVFGIFWRTIYRYVEVKTPGFAAAALFGYCWSAIPLHMRFFSVTIVNIIISISAALVVFALVSSGRSMRAAPHFQAIHPSRG